LGKGWQGEGLGKRWSGKEEEVVASSRESDSRESESVAGGGHYERDNARCLHIS